MRSPYLNQQSSGLLFKQHNQQKHKTMDRVTGGGQAQDHKQQRLASASERKGGEGKTLKECFRQEWLKPRAVEKRNVYFGTDYTEVYIAADLSLAVFTVCWSSLVV